MESMRYWKDIYDLFAQTANSEPKRVVIFNIIRKEVDIIWLVQNRANIVELFTADFHLSIVSTKCKFL